MKTFSVKYIVVGYVEYTNTHIYMYVNSENIAQYLCQGYMMKCLSLLGL